MRALHVDQEVWGGERGDGPELVLPWRWEAEEKGLLRGWAEVANEP